MSFVKEPTMKPVQAFRTSKVVTVSVSPQLHAQVATFAKSRRLSISAVCNQAVLEYLDTYTFLRIHNIRDLLKATNNILPSRTNTLGTTMKHESVRADLENLAAEQGHTVSALLRRALYEYTKPEDATPDPLATLDAWGDQPNLANTSAINLT
jgi:predicted transcriptional regulator